MTTDSCGEQFTRSIQRRAKGLRRVLHVVQVLAGARNYLTTASVVKRAQVRFGHEYHYKAIYEDLRLLVECGIVHRKTKPSQGPGATVWRLSRNRSESLAELCDGPYWDVFAVDSDGDRDRINSEPYNAAQVGRLLESITVPIKQLIVQPYEQTEAGNE